MWWIIVVGVVVFVVVIFVAVPALVHRAIGPSLRRRLSAVYSADQIVVEDFKALSFGLESKGAMQMRGNGLLVLTAAELHWFQFLPKSDVRIPRANISEVKTVRSHLGKSIVRELLHVSFTVDGKPDSMAWHVIDLAPWLSELAAHRKANVQ